MNSTPLFSILIANYNNGQYLQECLDSVFAQTYTNWEIILVDDASTDEISFELYKKYEKHPQIHIFYNETNRGCGYTKRRCVELAIGEICGFLDPDDALTTNAVKIMVKKHIELPTHSLIYSTHYICKSDLTIRFISTYVGPIPKGKTYIEVGGSPGVNISQFAVFKKPMYLQTSGINKKLLRAVDQDLYLKLEEIGKVKFINEPLYYYRQHKEGISSYQNELKAEYWNWVVKIKASERRGVAMEDIFATFYQNRFYQQKQKVKNSMEYKLGSLLLKPVRKIKNFLK